VTEPLEAVAPAPERPTPQSGHRRREILIFVLCLAVMVVGGLAAAGIFSTASPSPRQHPARSAEQRAFDRLQRREAARLPAIQALLRHRSQAILDHNRNQFVSTLDPRSPGFRRRQERMFHNLRRVRFAGWSYTFGGTGSEAPAKARHRYRAPTWIPADLHVHYRLAGFDAHSTYLPQYPTFVDRGGHWYLASFSDLRHEVSATDIWDYAPVHVIRRPGVLVLGPASELTTMATVAGQMRAAIPKVNAVWGRHWSRRVVVVVPSTQHEMALITRDNQNLDQIAALTSSEFTTSAAGQAPVGDRVTLNPANWPTFGSLGSSIVLSHELTHVATRADTGPQTPKWLSEGFADYVGFLDTGVPLSVGAAELGGRLRAGHHLTRLPTNRDFRGGNALLSEAYESAWLACHYIADHYGQGKLVRFYRAVGSSSQGPKVAVAGALHRLFHLTPQRFTALWHGFVSAQLA
jgi:hypothetical protein